VLPRILEPELMDTEEDARQYDSMDHTSVNNQFVTDLLNAMTDWSLERPVQNRSESLIILDLGAGTAQIPIELCRRAPHVRVTAIDAAAHMLALARTNIAACGLANQIELIHADAKRLLLADASFPVVISNSILHHIPDPRSVIAEAIRVTAPGGLLFHRDLVRPNNDAQLKRLVVTYAGDATPYQRKLFGESLRAALTVNETRKLVAEFDFSPDTVQMTSDRHWTWSGRRPS
jgi:ubiquinone/menaquinone biosynthesis C-methylase UbiE